MMSPARPRNAGAEKLTCAFLFVTSTSPLAVVPLRSSGDALPEPVRSSFTLPVTSACRWNDLTSFSEVTVLVRMSLGSVSAGAAGAAALHAPTARVATVATKMSRRNMNVFLPPSNGKRGPGRIDPVCRVPRSMKRNGSYDATRQTDREARTGQMTYGTAGMRRDGMETAPEPKLRGRFVMSGGT